MCATPLDRCRDEYLGHLSVERGLSRNTLDAYRRDLGCYLGYLAERGVVDARDVTRRDIEGFVAERREAGYAASSVNRELSAIKGFHRFMLREGLSETQPASSVRFSRTEERLPDCLSVEAAAALMEQPFGRDATGARDRAVLEVLYGCGVRASELTGLDVGDVF